jgi:hypothetical protein
MEPDKGPKADWARRDKNEGQPQELHKLNMTVRTLAEPNGY